VTISPRRHGNDPRTDSQSQTDMSSSDISDNEIEIDADIEWTTVVHHQTQVLDTVSQKKTLAHNFTKY